MSIKLKISANFHEGVEIFQNLRRCEKIWNEHFGFNNRQKMKYWQEKADKWLLDNLEPPEPAENAAKLNHSPITEK